MGAFSKLAYNIKSYLFYTATHTKQNNFEKYFQSYTNNTLYIIKYV